MSNWTAAFFLARTVQIGMDFFQRDPLGCADPVALLKKY